VVVVLVLVVEVVVDGGPTVVVGCVVLVVDVVVLVEASVLVVVVVGGGLVVVETEHAPGGVGGKLCGSVGSGPQSGSRRSDTPSRSGATPMRSPLPGGTQVKVSSCPAVAARLRTAVVVRGVSE